MKNLLITICIFSAVVACQNMQSNQNKAIEEGFEIKDRSVIALPMDYDFSTDSTFSILSWNVEHFVDPYDDPYIDHPREDSPSPRMQEKLRLLIKALREADADMVLLQEFESEKYLMQLAQDSFPELNYQFFADAASPNWYMNVVLMSRFPLGVLQAYGDVYTPLPNYLNEAGQKESQSKINTRMWSIEIHPSADYKFNLFGVHLKAGRGERNVAVRLGQIHLLQKQFKELILIDPKANIMMAGDFNSLPKGRELNTLMNSRHPASALIDPLDTGLYTHPADSPQRRLDYILLNPNMDQELLDGGIEICKFFSPDSMRMISDHLPLKAEIKRYDK